MKKSLDTIKELRALTSSSIADCKKALEESGGDIHKAIALLRKLGLELAAKRQYQGDAPKQGRIEAYIHFDNKLGALVEVNCETDFVARNRDFIQFAKDVAIHIAACNPFYLKKEDVPEDAISQEKDKEKFYKEHCLLEQAFIKDPSLSIKDCLGSLIAKVGENIVIRRFMRYKVGE